jgi:hypothetical protein
VCPRAADVEGEIDRDRRNHPTDRREHGDSESAPLAQLAHVELALGLQADDQKEEGHQSLVHPIAQVGLDSPAPDRDRELRRP